jgi:ATPase subunit of ABC transporter with duplicated ATPase domains
MISGHDTPDRGEVKIGASVRMGYFAQHAMEILSPSQRVIESLEASFPTASVGSLKTLAGAFGFPGDQSEKSCAVLSGGEKVRVVLAKMLYDPPNFLVLDEPTNHLDVETKGVLVRALSRFEGTMIFVSHDRRFLSKLSNRVLELDRGETRTYGGGYVEYVEESGQEAPGVH